MSGKSKNILFIVVTALIIFLGYRYISYDFKWNETYSYRDINPFGCELFDKVMKETLPNGYELAEEKDGEYRDSLFALDNNIFFVDGYYWRSDSTTIEVFKKKLEKGDKIFIASENIENFLRKFKDSIDYQRYSGSSDSHIDIKNQLIVKDRKMKVCWLDKDGYYGKDTTYTYSGFTNYIFVKKDSYRHIYATLEGIKQSERHEEQEDYYIDYWNKEDTIYLKDYDKVLILGIKYGKGTIYLTSSPLFFTNIAVKTDNISNLTLRMMNLIADKKVIRMDSSFRYYSNVKRSSLRYILEQRTLKYALYSLIFGFLLFMFFTAKRKQRVIKIIKEPENRHLDFIMKVAESYKKQNNKTDILEMKVKVLDEYLSKNENIDSYTDICKEENIKVISQKTGIEENKIVNDITRIKSSIENKEYIKNEEIKKHIQFIENIINKLKNYE